MIIPVPFAASPIAAAQGVLEGLFLVRCCGRRCVGHESSTVASKKAHAHSTFLLLRYGKGINRQAQAYINTRPCSEQNTIEAENEPRHESISRDDGTSTISVEEEEEERREEEE